MKKYLRLIDEQGISGEIVAKMIEAHKPVRDKCIMLYERYKASVAGGPILRSKPPEDEDFATEHIKRLGAKGKTKLYAVMQPAFFT